MPAHRPRPGAERHLARGRRAVKIEPGEDRFGVVAAWAEAAGEIAVAFGIAHEHVAVAGAGPEASLALDLDVGPRPFEEKTLHGARQRLAPARAIGSALSLGG